MAVATALGVFVDKEVHKTLLQVADNHKQLEYIQKLRKGVQDLTNYGHQARQHIGELSAALLECDVNLEACDAERIALLQREKLSWIELSSLRKRTQSFGSRISSL